VSSYSAQTFAVRASNRLRGPGLRGRCTVVVAHMQEQFISYSVVVSFVSRRAKGWPKLRETCRSVALTVHRTMLQLSRILLHAIISLRLPSTIYFFDLPTSRSCCRGGCRIDDVGDEVQERRAHLIKSR
jgi:hypothetical protein